VTVVTVLTNLAVAVFAGVVVSALGFAWKSAKRVDAERRVERDPLDTADVAVYDLRGPLFFGSTRAFADAVDALAERETAKRVVLDFANAKVWDSSALVAVDDAATKIKRGGEVSVTLRGLSPDCATLLRKAKDLVEVSLDDPTYAVAADYSDANLEVASVIKKSFALSMDTETLEPWQEEALRRQTAPRE
jgi:MFS superfamily sulfate permease-like transporter